VTVSLQSHPLPEFWERYDALPIPVQEQADQRYALFAASPYHPAISPASASVSPYMQISGIAGTITA